jgi:predicted RNA-binding Zn-ribbon protein involved in translation (DUF1610 family)
MSDTDEHKPDLNHFHECVHCGSAFRREEYEGRALTSGVYLCPKCGLEGPLNVVIREEECASPAVAVLQNRLSSR